MYATASCLALADTTIKLCILVAFESEPAVLVEMYVVSVGRAGVLHVPFWGEDQAQGRGGCAKEAIRGSAICGWLVLVCFKIGDCFWDSLCWMLQMDSCKATFRSQNSVPLLMTGCYSTISQLTSRRSGLQPPSWFPVAVQFPRIQTHATERAPFVPSETGSTQSISGFLLPK